MKKRIEKGSECFEFFGDLFKYVQEYYEPDSTEEYWDGLIKDADKLYEKYSKCEFAQMVHFILLGFCKYQDENFRNLKKGVKA